MAHATRNKGSAMMTTYSSLPNKVISANGIDYSYRDTGGHAEPLVLLQHFRGNLDNDSAHGFLFQHHAEFAADIETFLAKPD
jgi:hypothetical protein